MAFGRRCGGGRYIHNLRLASVSGSWGWMRRSWARRPRALKNCGTLGYFGASGSDFGAAAPGHEPG